MKYQVLVKRGNTLFNEIVNKGELCKLFNKRNITVLSAMEVKHYGDSQKALKKRESRTRESLKKAYQELLRLSLELDLQADLDF